MVQKTNDCKINKLKGKKKKGILDERGICYAPTLCYNISYNNSKYTLFILHPILSRFPFNHLSLLQKKKKGHTNMAQKSHTTRMAGYFSYKKKKEKRTKCTHKISF